MEIDLILRNTFMSNVCPRRQQELADARMVQEDHSAMANLSNTPVYKEFDAFAYQERLAMYNQSTWKRKGR
jgi:hypothetical protein